MKKLLILHLFLALPAFGAQSQVQLGIGIGSNTHFAYLPLEKAGVVVQQRIIHVRKTIATVNLAGQIIETPAYGGSLEIIDQNFVCTGQKILEHDAKTLWHQPLETPKDKVNLFKLAQMLKYPPKEAGGHIEIE